MPPDDLPDDLQRPLEESAPVAPPAPPAAPSLTTPTIPPVVAADPPVTEETVAPPAAVLRPAVPIEPDVRSHRRRPAGAGRARGTFRPLLRLCRGGGRVVVRGGRAVGGWSRGPTGRFLLPVMGLTVLVGATVATGGLVVPTVGAAGAPAPTGSASPAPPSRPPFPEAVGPTVPPGLPTAFPGYRERDTAVDAPGPRATALADWSEDMSARTDIPQVALQAYAYAELVLARAAPACGLSWTTLAAIGRVESNHGRTGGATLRPDGRAEPPIYGAALDGNGGRKLIVDTDGGDLDGDPVYDRAVGPMQFIPQTWRREAVDATGNGVADVQNIHDAALAAANYLCRNQRDLTTAEGWWSAVLAYNNVQTYADAVFAAANEYGQRSRA